MDKKLFIICGGIIGGLLLLLLIVWLISVSKPKYITYEALEKKITAASKNYVKDNESKFTQDNARYNLSYQALVNGEYIKPMEELVKDSENCVASVTIRKVDGEFIYIPYLNCGDKYTTIELYKQILNDNPTVTTGSGLYRNYDGSYYFRGKNLNNYVAFGSDKNKKEDGDYLWQILSIGKDNTIRLRALFTIPFLKTVWDNRYNEASRKNVGYNDFDDSVIQEKLKAIYTSDRLFNVEQKSKLVPKRLCIGARSEDDETIDGSTECSKLSKELYYFGTLTPYEYMRISTDENCKNIKSRSCTNFNFLGRNSSQSEEWTVTPGVEDNSQVYSYSGTSFKLNTANNFYSIYLVIDLNEYSFYKTGDGSKTNPYKIKLSTKTKEEEEKEKNNK